MNETMQEQTQEIELRLALEDTILMLQNKLDYSKDKVNASIGNPNIDITGYLFMVREQNIYEELYEKAKEIYHSYITQ